MRLQGKRVAVLAEKMYEDLELHYPRLRLLEEGANVHVIGPEAGAVYESKHGYPALTTDAAADQNGSDYDCIVIPGGYAPDHMRRSPDMIRLVREAYEGGTVIAAICHGPWMLCSVPDSINGRKVGCFPAIRDDVTNAGAEFVEGEEVTVDGPIITSRVPDDLPAFVRAIIDALAD
jgi:protease I